MLMQTGPFKIIIFAISDYGIFMSCFVVVACQNHAEYLLLLQAMVIAGLQFHHCFQEIIL